MHIYPAKGKHGKKLWRFDRKYKGKRIAGNYKKRTDAVAGMEAKMQKVDEQIQKSREMSSGFGGLCTAYLKDKQLKINPTTERPENVLFNTRLVSPLNLCCNF